MPKEYFVWTTEAEFVQELVRLRKNYLADEWYDPRTEHNLNDLERFNSLCVALGSISGDMVKQIIRAVRVKSTGVSPAPKSTQEPAIIDSVLVREICREALAKRGVTVEEDLIMHDE